MAHCRQKKKTKGTWEASPLSMKEGSLFCFVVMRSTELGYTSVRGVLGVFGKLWMRRGGARAAWFHHDVWTCGAKVLEY
jgi:hypothetical protein